MFWLSVFPRCCQGSNPSLTVIDHPVVIHRSNDSTSVITHREAEFRLSRAAPRYSCSSSWKRYSCSNKRHPRSHSRCCSTDRAHGQWDFPPFCMSVPRLKQGRFRAPLSALRGWPLRATPPLSTALFGLFLYASEEAEPRPEIRARERGSVIRDRKSDTRVRNRADARPTEHTAICVIR